MALSRVDSILRRLRTIPSSPRRLLIFRRRSGRFFRVEPVERAPVVLALAQDGDPREPRLRPFENEHLEEMPIVV